jgi:hypothetical protein
MQTKKSIPYFKKGQKSRKEKKYKEAFDQYTKAEKNTPRASVAIAEMYFKKETLVAEGEDYIEVVLKYLSIGINKKGKNRISFFNEAKALLDLMLKGKNGFTAEQKRNIYKLYADLAQRGSDRKLEMNQLLHVAALNNNADGRYFKRLKDILAVSGEAKADVPIYSIYRSSCLGYVKENPMLEAFLLSIVYARNSADGKIDLSKATKKEKKHWQRFNRETVKEDTISLYNNSEWNNIIFVIAAIEWLIVHYNYDESLAKKTVDFIGNGNNLETEELLLLKCLLAKYFYKGKILDKAKDLLEQVLLKDEPFVSERVKEYENLLQSIYQDLGLKEQLEQFNLKFVNRNKEIAVTYSQAIQEESNFQNSNNYASLTKAVELFKKTALKKHQESLVKLKELGKEHVEALVAVIRVLDAQGACQKSKAESKNNPFFYTKKEREDILKDIRKKYEEASDRYNGQIARLRYEGYIFEKNLFVARDYFRKAYEKHDMPFFSEYAEEYAEMCFYGEGGYIDIELAESILEKLNESGQITLKGKYILAEIYYLHYLRDFERPEASDKAFKISYKLFNDVLSISNIQAATEPNCSEKNKEELAEKARLSLQIMHERNPSPFAQLDDDGLLGKELCLTENVIVSPPQESSFKHAKEALQENDDTLPLRKIAEKQQEGDPKLAISELVNYYKSTPDGVTRVISTLCYELRRHDPKSIVCKVLFAILDKLNFKKSRDKVNLEKILHEQEATKADYFDENISDESDSEDEKKFQKSPALINAKRTTRQERAPAMKSRSPQ